VSLSRCCVGGSHLLTFSSSTTETRDDADLNSPLSRREGTVSTFAQTLTSLTTLKSFDSISLSYKSIESPNMNLIQAILSILAIISTKASAFVPSQSIGNFAHAALSSQNNDLNMSTFQQDISKCISECNKLTTDVFQDPSICGKAKEAFPDRRSLLQCEQGKELASVYACNALCVSDHMKSHLISVSVAKECNRRVGVGPKSRWCNHGYRYFLRNLKAAFTGSNIVESPNDDHDVKVTLKEEVTTADAAAANFGVEKVEKDVIKPKSPSTIALEDVSRTESTKEEEEDTVEKSEQGVSLDKESQVFVGPSTLSKEIDPIIESYDVSRVYNSLDEEKNTLVGVNVTSSLNWTVPPAFVGSTTRDYNLSSNERNIESRDVWLLNDSQSSATPSFFRPPPWSSLFEGEIGQDIGASAHPVDWLSNVSAFCNSSAINLFSRDNLMLSGRNATTLYPSEEAKCLHVEEGCGGSHALPLLSENIWSSMRSSSRHWLLGFGGASPNKASASSYDDRPNHHWSQVDYSPVASTSSSPTWCNVFVPTGGMRQFIAPANQPPTSIRLVLDAKGLIEIRKISLALFLAACACYGSSNESTTPDDDSGEAFLGSDNDIDDSPIEGMKQLRIQTKRCLLSSDLGPYWNSTLPDSRYRRRSSRLSQPPERFIPSF
jgi:hypothetical protein